MEPKRIYHLKSLIGVIKFLLSSLMIIIFLLWRFQIAKVLEGYDLEKFLEDDPPPNFLTTNVTTTTALLLLQGKLLIKNIKYGSSKIVFLLGFLDLRRNIKPNDKL